MTSTIQGQAAMVIAKPLRNPNKNTQTRTPKQEHPNNVRTLSRQFSKEKAAFVCARNDYLEQHVLQQHDST
jgi:hypothetical protein